MRVLAVFMGLLLCAGTGLAFALAPDGQVLYQKQCRACHGVDGPGFQETFMKISTKH